MDIIWIIAIVAIVLGIIVGNLLLLRDSANFKLPTRNKDGSKIKDNNANFDDDEDDKW
ncbi:DUF2897 family protein [Alteromonas halophila]|uniref:DUF2897 family protein n=1 Tax=Alteromonas halophila TaxID=516698 RepID=A0A918MVG5_9ALTE|nr:DUF2897 family protein [Alteromonas halophila]GGW76133.1 hypothetical protein GCM10007391_05780 [Alteromonas halophila]